MAEFNYEECLERLTDDEYSTLIANLIDEFFAIHTATTPLDVIEDQRYQDMFEVVLEHAVKLPDPGMLAIVSFMLGVHLAQKGKAKIPSNLN